uniref:Uncharacterized protein n=1 Tax=Oryza punctata TaxID=4537 RepID=A0A0E0LHX3_ORYPU
MALLHVHPLELEKTNLLLPGTLYPLQEALGGSLRGCWFKMFVFVFPPGKSQLLMQTAQQPRFIVFPFLGGNPCIHPCMRRKPPAPHP